MLCIVLCVVVIHLIVNGTGRATLSYNKVLVIVKVKLCICKRAVYAPLQMSLQL